MAKNSITSQYYCQNCGHVEKKWHGKCPGCQAWNSMAEEAVSKKKSSLVVNNDEKPVALTSLTSEHAQRIKTNNEELDRVLGGGIVRGSVTLLGGEPGCGKSTILQMTSSLLAGQGFKVLYVSGEESKEQIRVNAKRLSALHENIFIMTTSDIDFALEEAKKLNPDFLIVDSVQTLADKNFESSPGTVGQIREVSSKVIDYAKSNNIPSFLVGHVTKDGQIAGPRLLEHMVDTVLYFEHSRSDQYRLLRSYKNRFGSTNEIGLFEMSSEGLLPVKNPNVFFLNDLDKEKNGSAISCAIEGSRPFLVEIEALAVDALFGNPRRTCTGIDSTRASVIAAVLEKHAKIMLSRMDLFISLAGGIVVKEPSLDLALALAIISSVKNKNVPKNFIALGELGLSGEIRNVFRVADRLKEAKRLGFKSALVTKNSLKPDIKKALALEIYEIEHISEVLKFFK